jgi:OmpA family protein
MKLRFRALSLLLALPVATFAADGGLLGLYVGAGAGVSDIRDRGIGPENFSKNDFGWRTLAGIRPLTWLAVEGAYTDYGSPSGTSAGQSVRTDARTASIAALLYLPIPIPFVDVYGKYGYARNTGYLRYENSENYSHLSGNGQTIGLGAQWKFSSWAIRGEYEYLDTTYQDATFLSVSLVKTLF